RPAPHRAPPGGGGLSGPPRQHVFARAPPAAPARPARGMLRPTGLRDALDTLAGARGAGPADEPR
ncbi:hypothetical protein ACFW2E_42680, partial [Streptomyces sp. NPDC058964]